MSLRDKSDSCGVCFSKSVNNKLSHRSHKVIYSPSLSFPAPCLLNSRLDIMALSTDLQTEKKNS